MTVILFGASPWGTRALTHLDVGYHLVVPPRESLPTLHGRALSVTRLPFVEEPESALAAPCPGDAAAAVSFTEPGLLPAALVAAHHGLAGTPVTAVAVTRNKLAMRRALDGAVAQPRFGQVGVDAVPVDLTAVVVKPQSGTAGVGVSLVSTADLDPAGVALLWEEHIEGPEVSVETVSRLVDGHLHVEVIGITNKSTSGAPDFVELAHTAPTGLGDGDRTAVLALVVEALDRLGVTYGAAHTEVVLHAERGPVLIEVQTRPGGGRIPTLHELVTGVDHYESAVRALLDLPRSTPITGVRTAVARMILSAPSAGADTTALPRLRPVGAAAPAAVVDVELWPSARRPTRSNLDRHGVVVAGGEDPDAVTRVLDQTMADLTAADTNHEEIPA